MPKPAAIYPVDTIDANALASFFQTYNKAYEQIEQSLLLLDLSPNTPALLNELIDATQSIRGSLIQLGFSELQDLTQSLINLLEDINKGLVDFSPDISDIILSSINNIKIVIETLLDNNKPCVLLKRFNKICQTIEQISKTPPLQLDNVIKDALMLLDPQTEMIEPHISNADSLSHLYVNCLSSNLTRRPGLRPT